MARKRHTPDEIVAKLQRSDLLVAQGQAHVRPEGSRQ